ncbi:MAG TPA: RNA-binding domain-containing protein [Candidatus Bathyarchaeia archaeon]|nr:RNA-binding domain-containing protein [Candidatus Bathyarchaeia archaeon]
MEKIEVQIEVEVNPTEDEAKVKRAVENMFSNVQFALKPLKRGSLLTAGTSGTDGLTKLHNVLKRERIRAAARVVLFKGSSERSIVFYLNKQVAYAGHVSFSQPFGESPLGPIKVEIQCEDPVQVINWLAPKMI